MRSAQAPSPEDDSDYQPFGTPPDGYKIAIERMRKINFTTRRAVRERAI